MFVLQPCVKALSLKEDFADKPPSSLHNELWRACVNHTKTGLAEQRAAAVLKLK